VSGTLVSPRNISGTQDTDEPTYLPSCQPSLNLRLLDNSSISKLILDLLMVVVPEHARLIYDLLVARSGITYPI
jgi:hypothetical protein